TRCGQVYWPGTHYERMQRTVARILADPRNTGARGVH
ncbi:MAG: Mut7-C RNAse domain-containing protein, partial [Anaerolineae bacterium]